eukprot:COSAG01_NODE_6235_length_3776_cov_48.658961_2_plen_83_part_00
MHKGVLYYERLHGTGQHEANQCQQGPYCHYHTINYWYCNTVPNERRPSHTAPDNYVTEVVLLILMEGITRMRARQAGSMFHA